MTLVRRLYFDLTGLPPTPAEVDEFVADKRPDAYEQLVDKLLASPAFGERMATWWFDLVRFADTVGYHGDQDQRITPYRDYVIKSFNDNLPFDQFTIEQLAGDLLPNPTMWQRVATGYNRVLQTTHEGGAQDGEYRAKMLADRVRNFSEAWLAGVDGLLRMPRPQVRSVHAGRFLQPAGVLRRRRRVRLVRSRSATTRLPTQRPPEMLAWTLPVYEQMQKLDAKIAKLEESLDGLDQRRLGEAPRRADPSSRRSASSWKAQFVPTMVTKAVPPREIRILPRGNWMDKSGKVVQPHTPHFLQQLDTGDRRPNRLDLAQWIVVARQPAHRPRGRESAVEAVLRRRACRRC